MSLSQQKLDTLSRAVGRRKEAVAQVKLVRGTGDFIINNKAASTYLHNNSCSILAIKSPLEVLQNVETSISLDQINILVKVEGGGLIGQAEAIKLAVARAICQLDCSAEFNVRKVLKDQGSLTQDARVKERRKYGLKKARKAPQYNKR
uniref:Small ribosomal subunit protein uS9c n=1 Tax=Rotundella rotunda TaxID=1357779 RepID=A0A140GIH2_9CHLO|nr:ribosomal protein S9 [Rotundella rotunda]